LRPGCRVLSGPSRSPRSRIPPAGDRALTCADAIVTVLQLSACDGSGNRTV
jgi:hypothetical protein